MVIDDVDTVRTDRFDCWCTLPKLGSITHGATRANIALASASERIRAMEDALALRSLERNRRGLGSLRQDRALCHHAWIVSSNWSKCVAN